MELGTPTAPGVYSLVLLPFGPDTVRRLRRVGPNSIKFIIADGISFCQIKNAQLKTKFERRLNPDEFQLKSFSGRVIQADLVF